MQQTPSDYSSWNQADLDREYSPSSCAHRPLDEYLEGYAARSRNARQTLTGFRDLSYGEDRDETLDLFVPAQGARGLHVFFHGGFWSALGKDDFSYLAPPFLAAGMAFVSVNYSLMPAVDLDTIVRQSRAALVWLAGHAARFGVAFERIFLSGHSAGAHLAAMCLGTDWSRCTTQPAPPLGGACLISGVFDLAPLVHTSENAVFRLTPDSAARNSPLNHLPDIRHSLVLTCGERETAEFERQTHIYVSACTARGIRTEVVPTPGLDHFEVVSELADPASALFRAALEQMRRTT